MMWFVLPFHLRAGCANASATVATKPAFRSAWKAGRRCLVIADGFYEWRKSDKQPYFITPLMPCCAEVNL
jgi:putative SOS response-associated peptidase YedK